MGSIAIGIIAGVGQRGDEGLPLEESRVRWSLDDGFQALAEDESSVHGLGWLYAVLRRRDRDNQRPWVGFVCLLASSRGRVAGTGRGLARLANLRVPTTGRFLLTQLREAVIKLGERIAWRCKHEAGPGGGPQWEGFQVEIEWF